MSTAPDARVELRVAVVLTLRALEPVDAPVGVGDEAVEACGDVEHDRTGHGLFPSDQACRRSVTRCVEASIPLGFIPVSEAQGYGGRGGGRDGCPRPVRADADAGPAVE